MQGKAEIPAGFGFLSPLDKLQVTLCHVLFQEGGTPRGVPRGIHSGPFSPGLRCALPGFPACFRSVPLDKADCQGFPRVLHRAWAPLWGVNELSDELCNRSSRERWASAALCWLRGWGRSAGIVPSAPEPVLSLPAGSEQRPGHPGAFTQTPALSWFLCTTCKDTDSCIAVSWFNLIWLAATIIIFFFCGFNLSKVSASRGRVQLPGRLFALCGLSVFIDIRACAEAAPRPPALSVADCTPVSNC